MRTTTRVALSIPPHPPSLLSSSPAQCPTHTLLTLAYPTPRYSSTPTTIYLLLKCPCHPCMLSLKRELATQPGANPAPTHISDLVRSVRLSSGLSMSVSMSGAGVSELQVEDQRAAYPRRRTAWPCRARRRGPQSFRTCRLGVSACPSRSALSNFVRSSRTPAPAHSPGP